VKDPDKRITLEEIKKHPYFKDIDFDKVLRKEYGKIETVKKKKTQDIDIIEEEEKMDNETKEKMEYEKFLLDQQKIDNNKKMSFLKEKITVKEMTLDQKRVMKNYVRKFFYIKKEDIKQTEDFKVDVKEAINISSILMDEYKSEP